jgi:hypothetical protein
MRRVRCACTMATRSHWNGSRNTPFAGPTGRLQAQALLSQLRDSFERPGQPRSPGARSRTKRPATSRCVEGESSSCLGCQRSRSDTIAAGAKRAAARSLTDVGVDTSVFLLVRPIGICYQVGQ